MVQGIIEQVNKLPFLSPLLYSPLQNAHHYTITEYSPLQNEQRKAKRLTELMVELQLDSSKILTDQVLSSALSFTTTGKAPYPCTDG